MALKRLTAWVCGQVPSADLFALGGEPGVLRLQLQVAALCHSSCALVAEHLQAHPPSGEVVQALLPHFMQLSWGVCVSEQIAQKTLRNKSPEGFAFNSQVRRCARVCGWTPGRV